MSWCLHFVIFNAFVNSNEPSTLLAFCTRLLYMSTLFKYITITNPKFFSHNLNSRNAETLNTSASDLAMYLPILLVQLKEQTMQKMDSNVLIANGNSIMEINFI